MEEPSGTNSTKSHGLRELGLRARLQKLDARVTPHQSPPCVGSEVPETAGELAGGGGSLKGGVGFGDGFSELATRHATGERLEYPATFSPSSHSTRMVRCTGPPVWRKGKDSIDEKHRCRGLEPIGVISTK